jgi:uncharacterized protein (TIGR00297 family)
VKWLTPGGAGAALAVGAATVWGLGWRGLVLLLAFFISGSLLTKGGGQRTARQVLANGGVAGVAALFGAWPIAAGALAAAAGDTWATEIGALSPIPPRLITSGARVTSGVSGGVTLLGTVGGAAGAGLLAVLAWVFEPRAGGPGLTHTGWMGAAVAAAGVFGMLVDSVLGATLQGLFECPSCGEQTERRSTVCHDPVRLIRGYRWLDNDGVNLAATLAGGVVAGALL